MVRENNSKKKLVIISIICLVFGGIVTFSVGFFLMGSNNSGDKGKRDVSDVLSSVKESPYKISTNSLEAFDLYFLQLENNGIDKVYSPLSIKYALAMLREGASGMSKAQIDSVIGEYNFKKYTNNDNMSFANAMFIKNDYKNKVNKDYVNKLKAKYNAELLYSSFSSANKINNWVSGKTFKLIDKLYEDSDLIDKRIVLLNALAIDMEWKKEVHHRYRFLYNRENFGVNVPYISDEYQQLIKFNNSMDVRAAQIAGHANKYDIVKVLGEENIRREVGSKYNEWLANNDCDSPNIEKDVNVFLDRYIKEINSNYGNIGSSTDFSFYDDENVKVFAKELKEYEGLTLEYVGIMPKKVSLDEYIKNVDVGTVRGLINNLKDIKLENFEDGVVTEIKGFIPFFKIDYELKLLEDLKKLGVIDIFDSKKADLSGIISNKELFIDDAVHRSNIEFSNEGIKAAAVTSLGGDGSAGCGFEYYYDVPIEVIDLTFDKPYLFLIRDKKTQEVWFVGTVYNPISK